MRHSAEMSAIDELEKQTPAPVIGVAGRVCFFSNIPLRTPGQ
jgi:hypothetical protein